MALLTGLREGFAALDARVGLDVEPAELPVVLDGCDTEIVVAAMAEASALIHDLEMLVTVAAGVVARRSARELGHSGAAATRGHRTAVELVQSVSGGTRADAVRAVRVGSSLIETMDAAGLGGAPVSGDAGVGVPGVGVVSGSEPAPVVERWDAPLRTARFGRVLSSAQYDAIRRGLGEPPVAGSACVPAARPGGASSAMATAGDDDVAEAEALAAEIAAMNEVWRLAAEQLRDVAASLPAEELGRRARQVRDALDPAGAEERFARRFAQRSLRHWVDADGVHHAKIVFDDEMGAWALAMIDAALRPRRGGPRFVDSADVAAAKKLEDDPRTNDQLAYDMFMSVLRAGSLATASDVFGARQPGVRMVVVQDPAGPRDAVGRMLATAHLEDRGDAVPGSVIDRQLCESGFREVAVDSCGNPLDVGREQRLFTPAQRIALAIRDGGCRAPGCTVPASYCEAHHCDEWVRDAGRTDIDRGILLCRFHHMSLHNRGARITRDGHGEFVLHGPPGEGTPPVPMPTRSPVSWAWDPPPPPERASWRDAPAA